LDFFPESIDSELSPSGGSLFDFSPSELGLLSFPFQTSFPIFFAFSQIFGSSSDLESCAKPKEALKKRSE
jgi:hypothetical protein